MEGHYVCGWDGGGTKTTVELCSLLDDTRKERREFGALNPNGGAQGAMEHTVAEIFDYIRTLCGEIENCRALCIGGAGMTSSDDARARLTELIHAQGFTGSCRIVGDQETALCGALEGKPGMILIAGTGSICYGRNAAGTFQRAGGRGSLMDDGGSGYAIGRDILAAVVRADDGRAPQSVLTELVFTALGIKDLHGLMQFAYAPHTGKKQIAALCPLLDQALATGDEVGVRILAQAREELSVLVGAVCTKLSLEGERLALLGSLLSKATPLRTALLEKLRTDYPRLICMEAKQDAAAGAVRMAAALLKDDKKEEGVS